MYIIATIALLHGYLVSACALPPNVLNPHKQHASRSRSRLFMATPPEPHSSSQLLDPDPWTSSVSVPVGLAGNSSALRFWFGLLLSVSQAILANCWVLQLPPGGWGELWISAPRSVWTRRDSGPITVYSGVVLKLRVWYTQGSLRGSSQVLALLQTSALQLGSTIANSITSGCVCFKYSFGLTLCIYM